VGPGEGGATVLRDIRESPFAWQHRAALEAIAAAFAGQRRVTALGLYLTLTWLCSEARTPDHVTAYLGAIAERAGVSTDTARRYLHAFEEVGLLRIEQRKISERVHDANVYYLTTPPGTSASTPRAEQPQEAGGGGTRTSTPRADARVLLVVNNEYEEETQQQQGEAEQAEILLLGELTELGVTEKTARELVAHDAPATAAWLDWLAALPREERPERPAGFVVSKVRANEEAPPPRNRWRIPRR